MLGDIEYVLTLIVEVLKMIFECFGIIVLAYYGFKCFARWLKKDTNGLGLELGEGIAMALQFMMCGEVLHTIIAQDIEELVILGAIIVMRVVLTRLIHWEIKNEKEEHE